MTEDCPGSPILQWDVDEREGVCEPLLRAVRRKAMPPRMNQGIPQDQAPIGLGRADRRADTSSAGGQHEFQYDAAGQQGGSD